MSSKPLYEGIKLTKKFYMSLTDGVFLVSSVGWLTPFERDFAETVVPSADRETQWQRIRSCHVDGVNCDVFAQEVAFKSWMAQWKKTPEGRWIMTPE